MKTKNRKNNSTKKVVAGLVAVIAVAVVAIFGQGLYSQLTGSVVRDENLQYNNLIDLDNPINQIDYNSHENTSRLWNSDKNWKECVFAPVFYNNNYNSNPEKVGLACAGGLQAITGVSDCFWYNPKNPSEAFLLTLNEPKSLEAYAGVSSLLSSTRAAGKSAVEIVMNSGYNICPQNIKDAVRALEIDANLSCLEWDSKSLAIKVRLDNANHITAVRVGKEFYNFTSQSEAIRFFERSGKIFSNPFVVGWYKQSGPAFCDTLQTYKNDSNENTSFFYTKSNPDGSYTFSWDGMGPVGNPNLGNPLGGVTYSIDLAKGVHGEGVVAPVPFLHGGVIMGTNPIWDGPGVDPNTGQPLQGAPLGEHIKPGPNNQSVTISAVGVQALGQLFPELNNYPYWRVCYTSGTGDNKWQSTNSACGPWVKRN